MAPYSSHDLTILSDLEHVRKRPGMYVGNTGQRGTSHLVIELIDNVADRFLAGNASRVEVHVDRRLIQVTDDSSGLPFDQSTDDSTPLASKYLTRLHRHATADEHFPHLHFDGWGLGLFVVNALSESLFVRSWRNGSLWEQSFVRGVPEYDARICEVGHGFGTSILFVPDEQIFGDSVPDVSALGDRFKAIAHLTPGFQLSLNDVSYFSPNGLADWVVDSLRPGNQRHLFSVDATVANKRFQLAAGGQTSGETNWKSFANGNQTIEGGTHLKAAKRIFRESGWNPKEARLHVTLGDPSFSGPTGTQLLAPGIGRPMRKAVVAKLADYCATNRIGRSSMIPPPLSLVDDCADQTTSDASLDHQSSVPDKNSSIKSS